MIAALAVAAVVCWHAAVVTRVYGGNWTALFRAGDRQRLPPELEASTYRFRDSSGYDGQFYRLLARDPLPQGRYAGFIDNVRLRAPRILIPALAWLISGGGGPLVDYAYIAVVAVFLGAGVWWSARYLERRGAHPALGMLFLVLPGALSSIDRMLLDGPLSALTAAFMLYDERGDWRKAWLIAAAAALTRETGLALAAGLAVAAIASRQYRKAALAAAAALPALAWSCYVEAHSKALAAVFPPLEFPGWGILRRLFTLHDYGRPLENGVLRPFDVLAVLALAALYLLAARLILKRPPGATESGMALMLGFFTLLGADDYMRDPYAYARLPSGLAVFVALRAAAERRWWQLAPPLLLGARLGVYFVSPLWRVFR